MAMQWGSTLDALRHNPVLRKMIEVNHVDGTVENMHPAVLSAKAKANSADNPTWKEAMNGPEAKAYWEACKKEIEALKAKDAWDVVTREHWMNVIPGTWAFKCKRYPDDSVRKHKARFCARGDKQIEGVDYFETFAPVVGWMTVRLLLILSLILGWASKQVDYTTAFLHAHINDEVFVEMPQGF